MSPDLHQRVRKLFDEALELPEGERMAFLTSASAGDQEAFEAAVRLLAARAPGQSFLEDRPGKLERIGRYVIGEELGRGGMGVVYAAIDPLIGRNVAVKVIHVDALADSTEAEFMRERLFREARSAGQLFHPGIVTVLDVGQEGGLAFIAMERVDGLSLQATLSGGRRLGREQILQILGQTAAALDFAHQKQIVHRDVKPGNIILDRSGTVKLTDFGIAKINSTQKYTQTGMVMGTPSYMSPEQIEAHAVDGKSDQFSLAVVAFELLTGGTPFRAESLAGVAHAIVYGARPGVHAANPELPEGVDAVIARALARPAEERFATCAEFVRELEMALNRVPPAPPVPVEVATSGSTKRGTKRGGAWVFGLAGVLLAGLAGAGLYRYVWNAPSAAPPVKVAVAKPAIENPVAPSPSAPSPAAPVSAQLTAAPSSIKSGDFATLHWVVTGAVKTTIQPDVGVVEANATEVKIHPRTTTVYTLSATGPGGDTTTAQTQVAVDAGPAAPVRPLYDQAKAERAAGRAERAFQLFRQAADGGDARAMLALGNMSEDGEGTPKSYPGALQWYRMAAGRGNSTAMLMLGSMYYLGRGIPLDYNLAAEWFQKAADLGEPSAKYNLGEMYESGLGVDKKNVEKAKQLYQDAARLGNDEAKKRLAELAGKR